MSSTKRPAHQVSATPSSPHTSPLDAAADGASEVRTSNCSLHSSDATSTTSSHDTAHSTAPVDAAVPAAMPRTTEVLWNGTSSLGFTLKRQRKTGGILVSKLLATCSSRLHIGSELKLVGGFPVQQLTLDEVKKVMLRAPKPVSLVFLNADDVAVVVPTQQQAQQARVDRAAVATTINSSFLTDCSDDRGSFEHELGALHDVQEPLGVRYRRNSSISCSRRDHHETTVAAAFFDTAPSANLHRTVSDFTLTLPTHDASLAPQSPSAMSTASAFTTYTNYYAKPSASSLAKKRKVSKLRTALDRMSQLLNRPVRQSALNIPANKSIVV